MVVAIKLSEVAVVVIEVTELAVVHRGCFGHTRG